MRAAHAAGSGAAPDTFQVSGTVNMLPGRRLEAAVAVGAGTAVNTLSVIVVVPVHAVDAVGTAGTIGS